MAMEIPYDKNVVRNAVGRLARLGDLYDARTDSFVGFSIFNEPLPENAVELIKTPAMDINFMNSENMLEKFEKLNIVPELRASIMANLVSLEGHGKYLESEAKNKKARKSMIYSIQTEVEKMIFTEDLNRHFALDALDLDFATHFVVGITWGANTVISLEENDYSGKEIRKNVNDDLNEELRKFVSRIYKPKETILAEYKSSYTIEMYGDILPTTNLPKTEEEAIEMLKKLPRLVQMANRGKGKPIMYALMPISVLDDYLNGTSTKEVILPLDKNVISNFTNFMSEIMESKLEISDLMYKLESHRYCVPDENLRKLAPLKLQVEKEEMKSRLEFKGLIIALRSGNDVTQAPLESDFMPDKIKSQLKQFDNLLICYDCKEALCFGFDGFFYCSCGRAPFAKFSFKCTDVRHGPQFVHFDARRLHRLLKEIPPLNELNVLILGVTGVGKSTWINAFLNYLAFPSLDAASKDELLSVTSTSFQLTDEDDKTHTIRFGQDENEVLEPGQSATQDVKAHLFPIGDTLLRLIDTPGIGDVRGVEQDKENFKKILKYLSSLKWLNGICILLKPNESRLNVLFEFCIKELLTHLHRSATNNVVFCFTHSRETFYKPGDTRQPLGELLRKNQIDLYLNKNTMYSMDNESFRFLCAANQGIEFRDSVKKSFCESWNISVEETNRLISHFKKLEAHIIDDTISLNDARQNIVCLTKPIADISKNIQQNLAIIKDKREMLSSTEANEKDLVKMLFVDIIKLETEPLNHPRTVCGAASCVEYHPAADGSVGAVEYVKHCHSHCGLTGVPVNIVGDARIQKCWAMNGTLNCTQCGCSWDQHLHITYVQIPVATKITVQDVETKISGKKSERQQIEEFISKLDEIREEQEDEQRKIIEMSVKLGRYLSKNAILAYNDVLGKYIDHLIEKEEQKVVVDGNDDVLRRLKSMRAMYEEEVKALITAMAQPNAEEMTFAEFKTHLVDLYALKHNGAQLQNAIESASSSGGEKKKNNYEKFHRPKNDGRGYGLHSAGRFESCVEMSQVVVTKTTNDGLVRKYTRWITSKIWK
uniref:Uncharacterized protein n=1 Tax=Strigamia maritima TaxID=126957 RepID=T1IKP8_STRMM